MLGHTGAGAHNEEEDGFVNFNMEAVRAAAVKTYSEMAENRATEAQLTQPFEGCRADLSFLAISVRTNAM